MSVGQGSLRLQARLSVAEGDATYLMLRRLTRGTEKSSQGLRRAVLRYGQIMDNTDPPPPQLVVELHNLLVAERVDLLNRVEYPLKSEILSAVDKSAIQASKRKAIHHEIDGMSFAEYGKLMEAVELMLSRNI